MLARLIETDLPDLLQSVDSTLEMPGRSLVLEPGAGLASRSDPAGSHDFRPRPTSNLALARAGSPPPSVKADA